MVRILSDNPDAPVKRIRASLEPCMEWLPLDGEVTVRLTDDDEEIRLANLRFRRKSRSTDVLSFPMLERLPEGFYLGDILISLPRASQQAKENGHSLEKEILTLIVHGLLHLQGMDHERDEGQMHLLQERLVLRISKEWE